MGKRVESGFEVTASEPGHEFSLRSLSGPVRFSALQLFVDLDGLRGTLLTLVGDVDPGRLFGLAGGVKRKGRRAARAHRLRTPRPRARNASRERHPGRSDCRRRLALPGFAAGSRSR